MKYFKDIGHLDVWNQFILDGDLDTLSQIYFHYYDVMYDYGLRHTSDKQSVEDAIQDVFINLIKSRKGLGEVKNLTGYLIATFRRQLFINLNKLKRIILTEKTPEENFDYFKSPDYDFSDNENQEILHSTISQCISNLTSKQKEIIFLRFERELSYDEIAKTLHISVESCYKSTYRSIKIIRMAAEKIFEKKVCLFLCAIFRFKK
ncbi:MAG: sigma-70 family RNA polymerase sigma factor [Prolixibacteraceae bacterium]